MLKRVWKISHKLTKQSAIDIGALCRILVLGVKAFAMLVKIRKNLV
ncbi:hypothetical protein [Helicobacter colisuis]|uniref:Uncharacterized protein n=1 Tax=Helicobacter colisuis TaxID=2949739 RepID=A0ABT0TRX3_9HELI|nr:hypothetical protein [Helicobacter colisuis]MCL9818660.1 hypothetical protein [Helicobacter colisuis]